MVAAADSRDDAEPEPDLLQSASADDCPPATVSETRMSSSALNNDVSEPVADKSDTDITAAVTSM